MLDLKSQEDIFSILLQDTDNNHCIDCGSISQWASINNGIFLCLECSIIHRSFGSNISFVRSISMDSWTQEQLKCLQIGGNKKIIDFLAQYDITDEFQVDIKYKTKAAQFYREQLEAQVQELPFEQQQPDFEDGRILIENQQPNQDTSFNYISNSQYKNIQDRPQYEKILDKSKIYVEKFSKQSTIIYQKTKESSAMQKTSQILNTGLQKTNIIMDKMAKKTDTIYSNAQDKYQTRGVEKNIKEAIDSTQEVLDL